MTCHVHSEAILYSLKCIEQVHLMPYEFKVSLSLWHFDKMYSNELANWSYGGIQNFVEIFKKIHTILVETLSTSHLIILQLLGHIRHKLVF